MDEETDEETKGASHVVLVLTAPDAQDGLDVSDGFGPWLTEKEVKRVRGLIEVGVEYGLSNLTLVEEFTGPTNLESYFKYIQQHIEKNDELFSINAPSEEAGLLNVNLIPSYRGKADIISAVRQIIGRQSMTRPQDVEDIERGIGAALKYGNRQDPDLMVLFDGRRTVGQAGVWLGAYSEFAFLAGPWHSLTGDAMVDVLRDFGLRERRFGAV